MFVIAEVALSHDGSLGNAIALGREAARIGVDGVKYQYRSGVETSDDEAWRDGVDHPQDDSRRRYYDRTSFAINEWQKVADEIRATGASFGMSFFAAATMIDEVVHLLDFIKVPSGEIYNQPMWSKIVDYQRDGYVQRVFASEGLGTADVGGRVENLTLMKCVTAYPSQMRTIEIDLDYGLSDHSGQIWPGIVAAALKCPALEIHVCWDKRQFGPDSCASLDLTQLEQLIDGIGWIEEIGTDPITAERKAGMLRAYSVGRPHTRTSK